MRPPGGSSSRQPAGPAATTEAAGALEQVLPLARVIGNRALARLLQEKPTTPGRALLLHTALRGVPPRRVLARQLREHKKVSEGVFKLSLSKQSHPGEKSGLRGYIAFRPNQSAPDSTRIRLYQAVRIINVGTELGVGWGPEPGGRDDPRVTMQTVQNTDEGFEAGWFIDHDPALVKPRSNPWDPEVVPYYNRYWSYPFTDGFKNGHRVEEASLWDYPGTDGEATFSFETVAQAVDTGHVYGTVTWGFTISDGARGTIEAEHAEGRDSPLPSTQAALRSFNEYYRNPGAAAAPAE